MVVIKEVSERFKMELYRNTGYALCSPMCFMIANAVMSGKLELLYHIGIVFALGLFGFGFILILHAMTIAMGLNVILSKYTGIHR